MKIIIENTTEIIQVNGVPGRIWQGETDSGIAITCVITRIAVSNDEPRLEQFEKELLEQKVPTADVQAFPLRMIL